MKLESSYKGKNCKNHKHGEAKHATKQPMVKEIEQERKKIS